jgi:hypothetical protein
MFYDFRFITHMLYSKPPRLKVKPVVSYQIKDLIDLLYGISLRGPGWLNVNELGSWIT